MSPQISEQLKATPPTPPPTAVAATRPGGGPPAALPSVRVKAPRSRSFLVLLFAGLLLNGSIVYLGYLLFSKPKEEPPESRRIAVPYAGSKALLDSWREWPVQNAGRAKPFGTFALESVRQITGREKFERNDPVAVVLSWMFGDPTDAGAPDWERYPFILCDYHELRKVIFDDTKGYNEGDGYDAKLRMSDEEKMHGKYVEPGRLRKSPELMEIIRQAEAAQAIDDKAVLPMIQRKAMDVAGRLRLYDLIRTGARDRNGHAIGIVALDEIGTTWACPGEIKDWATGDGAAGWDKWLFDRRAREYEVYKGTPFQAFPQASVTTAFAAFDRVGKEYSVGEEAFAAETKGFHTTLAEVSKQHRPSYPDTDVIALELTFNKAQPFKWAWIAALFATVLLFGAVFTLERSPLLGRVLHVGGLAAFVGALGVAVYGFYCRVAISGRAPVSDMYESIIWVAFMTGVFGLVFEVIYRRGFIALAAAIVSTAGFVLADQLPLVFSSNIKPLEPVLRSNYWLIIHVLTIVSSYSAFALAWGLGNINICLILFSPGRQSLIKTLSHYSYRAIQVGVVMLFAGTMLGGWWANESWGRFWGWDPKEVWALIAFLCYVIPLHARYVGLVKDFGLAACSVVCFAAVVMAWYGVNYILGTGLHSYGFGSGNNDWVYFFGLVNISLVLHAGMRYMGRRDVVVE